MLSILINEILGVYGPQPPRPPFALSILINEILKTINIVLQVALDSTFYSH